MKIKITGYFRDRCRARQYTSERILEILRTSTERYYDHESGRMVKIGIHVKDLVIVVYDQDNNVVTPVTVYETSRQQIRSLINEGRLAYAKTRNQLL